MKLIIEFLRPDWRKIVLVFVFLFLLSITSLFFISSQLINILFRYFNQGLYLYSTYRSFYLCNTTMNVSDISECFTSEIDKNVNRSLKSEDILFEIERENDKYVPILFVIYPGIGRLINPILNLLSINYEKYLQEITNLYDVNLNESIPFQSQFIGIVYEKTNHAFYQLIFELILMIVYFYVVSSLIVWVYDKVKKK